MTDFEKDKKADGTRIRPIDRAASLLAAVSLLSVSLGVADVPAKADSSTLKRAPRHSEAYRGTFPSGIE